MCNTEQHKACNEFKPGYENTKISVYNPSVNSEYNMYRGTKWH